MDKLDRLGWVVHGTYDIGGFHIGVRTTSSAFGAWLEEALAGHRRSGKSEPHFSLVGSEDGSPFGRRRNVLYRGAETVVRTDDVRTLARALLAELEAVTYAERDDAVYLDAAVVSIDGRVGLVPAGLLSYISPATRRAERIGLFMPGARTVALDPSSGLVVPVRRLVAPEATLDGLEAGQPDRLFVDEPLGVDAVIPVAWDGNERKEAVSGGVALYHMGSAVLNLPRLGQSALEGVRRMVEAAHRYELSALRPALMIDTIAEVLRELPVDAATESAVRKIRGPHNAFVAVRGDNGES